jgi:ComF family protein
MFYHPKKQKEAQNKLIYLIKHRPNRRISAFVARELVPIMHAELAERGYSERREDVLLVSLPRSCRSKIRYGFDQSELICREIAKQTSLTYQSVIGRRRGGREQKHLTGRGRFGNVKSAFYLKNDVALSGKCVLLFDDIVTTGASMSGSVSLLQKAGAKEIIGFCIAEYLPKKKKRGER